MRLGLNAGYSGPRVMSLDLEPILEAERLGFDSVWTAEAYGSDAISPLAWIGARTSKIRLGTAIMQMPGADARDDRDDCDDDGCALGRPLHPGNRPVGSAGGGRMARDAVWQAAPAHPRVYRDRPHDPGAPGAGRAFTARNINIPYTGPGSTGLGKPLKSILHGRADMPIYTASISPKGIALSGRDRRRADSGLDEPRALRSSTGRISRRASPNPVQRQEPRISTWRRSSPASWATISTNAACR